MPRAIVGPLQKHIRITAAAAVVLGLVVIGSASLGVQAQAPPDPVQWSLSLKSSAVRPGGKVLATLTASIQPGWHLYSPTTPKGGPNPTKVKLADNSAVASVQLFEPAPARAYDANFKLNTETYEKEAALLLVITIKKDATAGPSHIQAQVRYQACQATICLPPKTKMAEATLTVDSRAKPQSINIPKSYIEIPAP